MESCEKPEPVCSLEPPRHNQERARKKRSVDKNVIYLSGKLNPFPQGRQASRSEETPHEV